VFTSPQVALNRCLQQCGWTVRGGVAALAAAGLLAAASASAEVQENGSAPLLSASLQSPDTTAAASPSAGSDTDIRNRIESAAELAIAGEKLHGALLRQFYAGHNFEPVWPARQSQAQALVNAVLRAGEHGLDPDLFHGALLRKAIRLTICALQYLKYLQRIKTSEATLAGEVSKRGNGRLNHALYRVGAWPAVQGTCTASSDFARSYCHYGLRAR